MFPHLFLHFHIASTILTPHLITRLLSVPDIKNYISLLRPKQWIKNAFLFAPLVFARELFELEPALIAVRAFLVFCFSASITYILNDIADAEADRIHPEKKTRPIAARVITPGNALVAALLLAVIVAVLLIGMEPLFLAAVIIYFALNLAYSFKLKEVVLLDVFIISAGFMLRVLGGAYAINVHVSSWIVLCTLFISLFLGFAKRRGELVLNRNAGTTSERKVLIHYDIGFIDQMLTVTAAGAVISYALYTVAPRTVQMYGTEKMIYTTVFVLYGIFRYLYLVHMRGTTENPTRAVTSDPTIVGTGVLWIIACIVLIYAG